jgi:cellulose synthase/poly-beta-1,6-N-acetylglucosamine synthase-like glycosyltransferase
MFSVATKVFIVSMLGLPISYLFNKLIILMELSDYSIILLSFLILITISITVLLLTRAHIQTQQRHERIDFYSNY